MRDATGQATYLHLRAVKPMPAPLSSSQPPPRPTPPLTTRPGRRTRPIVRFDAQPVPSSHIKAVMEQQGHEFSRPSDVPSDLAARVFDKAPRALPFSSAHHKSSIKREPGQSTQPAAADEAADWAQCDKCDKWRLLPPGMPVPCGSWDCSLNPDASRNACEIPEGAEVSEAAMDVECTMRAAAPGECVVCFVSSRLRNSACLGLPGCLAPVFGERVTSL